MAAAAEAVAFGVRRVTAEECFYIHDSRGAAPFFHAAVSPGTAISGFMRLIDRRLHDPVMKKEMELMPQYNFTRQLGFASFQLESGTIFSPHRLAGILISELKHTAEAHLGREIENAVITVPRHLTYDGRQGLRFAGRVHGGFRSVKVVDEQIAAAAAHGHHLKPGDGKVVLVFHVGGRTTHATIFKLVNGMAWYINARDDLFFGGDDFTARLVDHLVELIKLQHGTDIRHDKAAMLRLRAECERAKKALSDEEETLLQVEDLFSAPLTRAKFQELNRDLFERAIRLLDWVVMKASAVEEELHGLLESRKALIDEILLVGGSSKTPWFVTSSRSTSMAGRSP